MNIGYNHDKYYKIPDPDSTDRQCPYCSSKWNYTLSRTVDAREQGKILIKCISCKNPFWIDSYSNAEKIWIYDYVFSKME